MRILITHCIFHKFPFLRVTKSLPSYPVCPQTWYNTEITACVGLLLLTIFVIKIVRPLIFYHGFSTLTPVSCLYICSFPLIACAHSCLATAVLLPVTSHPFALPFRSHRIVWFCEILMCIFSKDFLNLSISFKSPFLIVSVFFSKNLFRVFWCYTITCYTHLYCTSLYRQ